MPSACIFPPASTIRPDSTAPTRREGSPRTFTNKSPTFYCKGCCCHPQGGVPRTSRVRSGTRDASPGGGLPTEGCAAGRQGGQGVREACASVGVREQGRHQLQTPALAAPATTAKPATCRTRGPAPVALVRGSLRPSSLRRKALRRDPGAPFTRDSGREDLPGEKVPPGAPRPRRQDQRPLLPPAGLSLLRRRGPDDHPT